ncbi:TetR/AcrR family transcriptional regulator [Cohnella sp. REN36]|uniref:TetR/AcrR family transcriptional regulator n=1 Tax=Cohnella sp. REN36 TaxID=2887347 RepID=UPI001D148B25|nr:TetR/AcrR family transcriptional regulator [Cohnella sp. REN36]MCC3373082.1 TetR/AcrR family transcriptional regulator [Cohnella sp. REN36]
MREEKASVNRKTEIIAAAIDVFAEIGYYRATTAQVAERAQISQPYVFRFFKTKEALMVAALEVAWARLFESFRQVIASVPPEVMEQRLIEAYDALLQSHKNEVLLQMQAQTMNEEAVRDVMRQGIREVRQIVLDAFAEQGAANPKEKTVIFLAIGMLCNMATALDMPELKER